MRLNFTCSILAALTCLFAATGASAACNALATSTATVGPHSPNAVNGDVAPFSSFVGGFYCSAGSPVLSLLGANYLKATLTTASPKLTHTNNTNTVDIQLAAKSTGTPVLVSGTPTFLINGTLLDLLGLTGSVPSSVSLFIKPRMPTTTGTAPPPGVYTGTFKIKWEWNFCSAVGVGEVCLLGVFDKGSAETTVTATLTISGVAPTVSTVTTTTWDPLNGANNPKAIPASKRRITATVGNPDVGVQDNNVVAVVIATPTNTSIALDGDGTGSPFAAFTEGSPASGLAFNYTSSTSAADDVEFSDTTDQVFTFQPTAATQSQVKYVRLKTRGAMAGKSNFKVSVAYVVK
jgi:hypothetical protein